jgi:S-adenosylmethionine hydrolase
MLLVLDRLIKIWQPLFLLHSFLTSLHPFLFRLMAKTVTRLRAPIALLSDFGYRDHYVGAMKGVIASIAPDAPIIDVTHGIPPQQVLAGAIALRECLSFFPRRTVFLAVVDPGVGTARRPIAIETRGGASLVGPDNGLLWPAAMRAGVKAMVELRSARYRLPQVSASFHGRDIFAPAAAWLWRGLPMTALGPAIKTIAQLEPEAGVKEMQRRLNGQVIYIDGFGNLITNISRGIFDRFAQRFQECRLSIRIKGRTVLALHKAYADAPQGDPLAIFGSFDLLEIAVRDGNAAKYFATTVGAPVLVRAERPHSAE